MYGRNYNEKIYYVFVFAFLLFFQTSIVFAQPTESSTDFCKDQAKQLKEKENRSALLLQDSKKAWLSVSKNFPSNSKREYKKGDIFVLREEREALRLVEELLKNGGAEDNFLRKFQWDRYENDVLFAFRYIKMCRSEFQGLYRSIGRKRRETYQRLEKIKKVSKKVEELYKRMKPPSIELLENP